MIDLLNRMFASMRPIRLITLAYLVLDSAAGTLSMVSAGHLPPIVVDPAGRARLLDVEGDPPIGAFRAVTFRRARSGSSRAVASCS